jgi:hypothetical protein
MTQRWCMAAVMNAYCTRCAQQVEPLRAWPGFVWVKRAWYAGVLGVLCFAPIIMSEITLLLPLAVTFGLAAGPVHALAAQKATCRDCGCEL